MPENESLDNAYENMSWERKNYRNVISNHKKQIANSVNNDLFLIKSDEAISRLETASYRDQNELIRDAAYAYFGQSYRLIADMVPETQKKYQETSLEEHMKKNINNPEFLKVLQAEDGSFKSPKQIAEEVKDQKHVKRLVDENMEKYKKQNLNKPVNNAAKKQENNAIKQENNVKANQSKPEDNKKAVNVLNH